MIAIGFGPSLTMQRAPMTAAFDFTPGVLPPGASLTRASIGSRFDGSGTLRIAPIDEPRFDHDPATGTPLGLLIEPERTNDVIRSAALTDAAWSGSGTTNVADAAAAPDGTPSADRVEDALTDSFRSIIQYLPAFAARTISGFIAKDGVARTTRFALVRGRTASASIADFSFDTATGEWSTGGPATMPGVRDCGDFWRIAFHCDCEAIQLFPAVGAGVGWQQSATATGSVIGWGFQAERGTTATSYIPTADAPATRAADVLALDWRRFGIPDGPLGIRYIFDDGTAQTAEIEVANGASTVPTTLARPWLRRVERR